MPPSARAVGLMLLLGWPACLAAQTPSSAGTPSALPAASGRPIRALSLQESHRELQAAAALEAEMVRRTGFESPSPSPPAEAAAGAERSESPPHQVMASPAAEPGEPTQLPRPHPAGSIPLEPRSHSERSERGTRTGPPTGPPSMLTIAGSLGVVLGLFFLVAWAMRRTAPGGAVRLPPEVFEVLGRSALAGREQVHLLRCGGKLLLVSVSPTGVEPLTEITDPDEVNRLAGFCRQAHPASTTAAFRQVFGQLAGLRRGAGLADDDREPFYSAEAGAARTRGRTLEDRDV